jgi:hypothetical protein
MDRKRHWETVYGTKAPEAVSWYRPHLETSLALIERAAAGYSASIIDAGGGESTLVDPYHQISLREACNFQIVCGALGGIALSLIMLMVSRRMNLLFSLSFGKSLNISDLIRKYGLIEKDRSSAP